MKNPPANAGDTGSIPSPGRYPGEGNGNPLQYYCLENPMDRGAWQAKVHGVAKELDTDLNSNTTSIQSITETFCQDPGYTVGNRDMWVLAHL